MTVTLETVIKFKDDPWSVPQPSMNTVGNNSIPLKTRFVWYALLHIIEYPIFASDIHNMIQLYGETVSHTQIGHIMKKLCKRGYFTRHIHHRGTCGPYYKYMPTNVFTLIQDQWRNGVV